MTLNQLMDGESATIKLIVAAKQDIEKLNDLSITVGQEYHLLVLILIKLLI